MNTYLNRPWEADPEGIYDFEAALRIWNDFAILFCLPQVESLTDVHKTKLKARLHDTHGITGWARALSKIRESHFLQGDNEAKWRADLDFILEESSFSKLTKGAYSDLQGVRHEV